MTRGSRATSAAGPSEFTIDAVLAYPHLVVTGRGRTSAIFDDLMQRHGKKRRAQTIVSSFSAVPQLLAASDMIGVFTQLAADAFTSSYKLMKRPVPINVGTISTTWSGTPATIATRGRTGCVSRSGPAMSASNRARQPLEAKPAIRRCLKDAGSGKPVFRLVRPRRLELPRFYPLPPQGSASTNSATAASVRERAIRRPSARTLYQIGNAHTRPAAPFPAPQERIFLRLSSR